jgi:uroporphyrin-III C-methyltransferase/precorrin-2 dehydrogenase/sirohydrochlorin ferrochelatase/precorrin-2 dehydrogenase/sirohydrochlorin ferrochelatase
MAYFPMFVNLEQSTVLLVGGGSVAERKAAVLTDFCGAVRVVAPVIKESILQRKGVLPFLRPFQEQDLEGVALVVAATNDPEENAEISRLCQQKGIPVNAVDDVEHCNFIFPSYVKRGDVVTAVSSGGKSPLVTQYLRDRAAEALTEEVAELTEFLGDIRERVKEEVDCERQRKAVYRALFQWGMNHHRCPEETVIEQAIQQAKEEP